MRQRDLTKLGNVFGEMVRHHGTIADMADELDMVPGTLRAELAAISAPNRHNKLGLVTGLRIVEVSGVSEPFVGWINARWGYLPPMRPPRAEPPAGESLHQALTRISNAVWEIGKRVERATDGGGPGGSAVVTGEREDIHASIMDAAAELAQLDVLTESNVVDLHPAGRRRG